MDTPIQGAARDLARSKRAVALTGAGISVESGIPPFRGKGGVWEKFDPMAYAHIDAFLQDPERVWREFLVVLKETLDSAAPNAGHHGLARLEALGILTTIITQNIDGLHQAAGNSDVIEFHGTFARYRCMACGARVPTRRIDTRRMPPRCDCGGIFRPECVFFGEMIPPQRLWRSEQVAASCDVMLVVGTSAVVQPAALMPLIAKQSGATVIEINPERTPLTDSVSDYFLQGGAGETMTELLQQVQRHIAETI